MTGNNNLIDSNHISEPMMAAMDGGGIFMYVSGS